MLLAACLLVAWAGPGTVEPNTKTRAPHHVVTVPASDPAALPFENVTTLHLETMPLRAGESTWPVTWADFAFRLPAGAVIKGLKFTMEQCTTGVHFPWRVEAQLMRNNTVLSRTTSVYRHDADSPSCWEGGPLVTLGGQTEMWDLEDILPSDFSVAAFGVRLQLFTTGSSHARRDHNDTHEATTDAPTTAALATTAAPTTAAPASTEPTTTTATTPTATTTPTSTAPTTTTATTPTTTTSPTTTTAASTTTSPTTAASTSAAAQPAKFHFRNPQLTIYYLAVRVSCFPPLRVMLTHISRVGSPVMRAFSATMTASRSSQRRL